MTDEDFEQFKADVRGLIDDIGRIQADNKRLRALVEDAYEEGWDDAMYGSKTDDGDWLASVSRAALQPEEDNQ